MAEKKAENEFQRIASDFLLNPEIEDEYSLEDFKDFFPSKYREHDDVKVLHEAFIMKRKKLKHTVKQNIQEYYKVERPQQKVDQNQDIKDAIAILEKKKRQTKKELSKAKNELKCLQSKVKRCNQAVKNCGLMKHDLKKYLDMGLLEQLEEQMSKQDGKTK